MGEDLRRVHLRALVNLVELWKTNPTAFRFLCAVALAENGSAAAALGLLTTYALRYSDRHPRRWMLDARS